MICRDIIYNHIKSAEGWVKKVELYVVAEDYSPENVGRRLRELEEEGLIEVGYYNGKYSKNLAKYRLKGKVEKVRYYVPDLNREIIINK